ncbi:hypothetical protein PDESU_00411 [Pontiella desulfatans]|uniref:Uncharacterized protein n=1 Tax=Pontiella desulfatans TaxID=2750659 RepID=A0A6C2TWI9_PONDE|nr:hypothetical protein [Pontiella desulfatans]VGO11864.1 hypothetical protein PDESU_00411 [Pontiella desulfatans]
MSEEKLTIYNLKNVLAAFIETEKLEVKSVAKTVGCPSPAIGRILCGITWPSDEMLKRCHTMMEIGFKDYKKLSEAQKEKISEKIGAVGGGGLGVGASLGAVSVLGSIGGLSAAGMASGLAALGALVGGGMAAGIAVAAAIPLGVAAVGYGTVKLVKSQFTDVQLKKEAFEPRWERPTEEVVAG